MESETYTCPRCGAKAETQRLAATNYTCGGCSLQLAYLDVSAGGTVRGVIGWLQAVGTLLHDRYRITGVLGRGGFGATYLVQDALLKNKTRALKEIPAAQYDEYEVELLSQLHHRAIPDISDRFEVGEMRYLVLEFGGKRTMEMERQASGGKIAVARLLPWMRQLCDVLIYLHAQQPPIVHRDLKPANILLDERDNIMLIDFGIAKQALDLDPTRELARAASPGFSPPEQLMGTGTDARADVYALGATLYALLTGIRPVPANELFEGAELPSPRTLNPDIPPVLDAAIIRAMKLNRNERQQSIKEFDQVFTAVEELLKVVDKGTQDDATQRVDPEPPSEKRRLPVTPIALAIGVVVVAIALWLLRGGPEPITENIVVNPTPNDVAPPAPQPHVAEGDSGLTAREALQQARREEATRQANQPPPEPTKVVANVPPQEPALASEAGTAAAQPPPERAAKPPTNRAQPRPKAPAVPKKDKPKGKFEIIDEGAVRLD